MYVQYVKHAEVEVNQAVTAGHYENISEFKTSQIVDTIHFVLPGIFLVHFFNHNSLKETDQKLHSRFVYTGSLPLSPSWLSVPLLCITLASSPSGWGASASSGAARASHANGGPALVLQKHTKPQVDNSF